MKPYYIVWQGKTGGWFCATAYATDGSGESMGKAWEQSDYAGPFDKAAMALAASQPIAKVDA